MKGSSENRLALAHQMEAFARESRLKPLEHYLKRRDRNRGDGDGTGSVLAMLRGMASKQGSVKITRLTQG